MGKTQKATRHQGNKADGPGTRNSEPGTSPRVCELCGGPLNSNNRSGMCSRTSRCRVERVRRWVRANPDKRAQYARRKRRADREKQRLYHVAWNLARGKRITGRRAKELRGHQHPNWRGGRVCYCDHPGCAVCLDWRCPSAIKPNGTFCWEHRYSWRKRKEAHHGPQQAKVAS